jgi:hypothetical protein
MFNNKFKFDAAADIAKSILEADTKTKMEALKGDQEKLDKNRNGKLDAHDFKILRGEKKVNEAEANYQSSYRVGKTANFKPKASDVGQGRKITGKMGKYGKQPDDDNMVEPPPEHKVGDVKTDPSAVVPGHSTIAAKLHLQTLPKDAEGNRIVKGARKVNAADLVAKRKAMMAADEKAKKDQKNEEYEQLDEIGDTPRGKAALQSYVDKAEKQVDAHWDKVRDQSHLPPDKKMVNRARSTRKADQRILGFHKYGGPNKGYGAGPGPKNEEYVEEGMEDTLHPAGAALLKHIKPQHHNLYKPHLTKGTFNGSYGDRTAVLKAAKDAGHLKMDLRKQNEEVEELDERELTSGQAKEKERLVHGMKKSFKDFQGRYGDRAKSVMYATATKQAKKD